MIITKENFTLKDHNTFKMDVKCAKFLEVDNMEDLPELAYILSKEQQWLCLGGGSNLLFTKDYPGAVVHCAMNNFKIVEEDSDKVKIFCEAGRPLDDFVKITTEMGLWGLENLSGIPGDVGASAVQNVGAYGVEACDVIEKIKAFDLKNNYFVEFEPRECGYGYRESMFKHLDNKMRYIIAGITFIFSKQPSPHLDYPALRAKLPQTEGLVSQKVRETIIEIRNSKLPDPALVPSAGSFFRNPVITKAEFEGIEGNPPHYLLPDNKVKIPAAWLIEQCGWKGRSMGNAAVWHLQPLVLVNQEGKATPDEILALQKAIINNVKDRFNISLQPEVEFI